jgi:hypothetical protein
MRIALSEPPNKRQLASAAHASWPRIRGVRRRRGERRVPQEFTGACELCRHKAPRAQMSRHIAVCAPEHDKGSRADALVQLHIEADGAPEYWLYVEGRETATL